MSRRRSDLQRKADAADCDLWSLICRVERMYDEVKGDSRKGADLHKSLMKLRNARSGIRALMHMDDLARTL